MTYTPRPGDFGLTTIGGFIGFLVGLGQFLCGDGSRFTHAFVVIDEFTVVEAEPGGARRTALANYKGKALYSNIDLTDEQRKRISAEAEMLVGTPYSFLDYLSIALHRFHIRPRFVEKYVESTGHMICSQLVDQAYKRAGVHLFDDGRLPQDVTPGDLTYVLVEPYEG